MSDWLSIPLSPVAASRARVSKWSTYFVGPYKTFRKAVELWKKGKPDVKKRTGALIVSVLLFVQRPKTTKLAFPKPDVDNYCKAVFDALNELAWDDDQQIVTVLVHKQWAETPDDVGCHVMVEEAPPVIYGYSLNGWKRLATTIMEMIAGR